MKRKLLVVLLGSFFFSTAYADTKILTPEAGGSFNKEFKVADAQELKVATYNIAAGRVSDVEHVAMAIKAINADIISLNEVDVKTKRSNGIDQVSKLAGLTGMHGAFGKALNFEGGEYGIAILSKYPIEKQQVFNLPSGNGESRVLLVVQLRKPGVEEPIIYMTTHLDWQENPAIKLNQIREIENIAIGNTDSKFSEIASRIKILSGDFNDVIGGPAINELVRYWNPVKKEGQDFRTWPAANPALDLDHIFTFKGQRWSIENVAIPNKTSEWKGVNWPATSDHVPISVTMKLLEQ